MEVIKEQIDLKTLVVFEFAIEKDLKRGAFLRVHNPDDDEHEPDLFTAPTIDFLFETASLMLRRLANAAREGRRRHEEAQAVTDFLGQVFHAVEPIPGGDRN